MAARVPIEIKYGTFGPHRMEISRFAANTSVPGDGDTYVSGINNILFGMLIAFGSTSSCGSITTSGNTVTFRNTLNHSPVNQTLILIADGSSAETVPASGD